MVLQHFNGDKVLVGFLQCRREAGELCLDHLQVDRLLLLLLIVFITQLLIAIVLIRLVEVRHLKCYKMQTIVEAFLV